MPNSIAILENKLCTAFWLMDLVLQSKDQCNTPDIKISKRCEKAFRKRGNLDGQ